MNAWKPIYTRKERITMAAQAAGLALAFALFFSTLIILA